MSEIEGTKATLISRCFGAVAAASTYFPGVPASLIIAVAATFLARALRRTGDAVCAFARHGLLFCLAGRALHRWYRIRLEAHTARRGRTAPGADHDIRDHEARAYSRDHGDRRRHADHSVRRRGGARRRAQPPVRHLDGGCGGDLWRVRGAGDFLGPAQERKPRARYGFQWSSA